MTRKQLSRAQFLWHTWRRAVEIAEEIDPGRGRKTDYNILASWASAAFLRLTGRLPSQVKPVELHDREPAEWAKKRRPPRGV